MTSSTSPKTFRYTFTFFNGLANVRLADVRKKVLANVTKIPWQMSQNMGWQMSGWQLSHNQNRDPFRNSEYLQENKLGPYGDHQEN